LDINVVCVDPMAAMVARCDGRFAMAAVCELLAVQGSLSRGYRSAQALLEPLLLTTMRFPNLSEQERAAANGLWTKQEEEEEEEVE
jgi:hypothetical protein